MLKPLAHHLDEVRPLERVVRVTGYRAVLMPPAKRSKGQPALRPPPFDVMALIETTSPEALGTVAALPPVAALRDVLGDSAWATMTMRARCTRALDDVDKRADGTYLFNFWAARDRDVALQVWEHLAPWFQTKTGLRNSTVLQPIEHSEFALVNHARWDRGVVRIAAHQFLRPSFYTFVRRNLTANDVHVYPNLYRRI